MGKTPDLIEFHGYEYFNGDSEDEPEREKKPLKAWCSSIDCTQKATYGMVEIPGVPFGKFECPNCAHALFWGERPQNGFGHKS